MFTLKIETDNAAFEDNLLPETARILRAAADKLEQYEASANLRDSNGNAVGKFGFSSLTTPRLRRTQEGLRP